MSDLLKLSTAPEDFPPHADTPRERVLHRSHLVGGDLRLTRAGGGNFSAKGRIGDEPVLWMSSWGCDGAATTEDDFPALYLDRLLELRHLEPLDDRTMLDRIAAAAVTGEQKPPGIETLTHAFIPATHVDHCHPDAVIALTSIPDGKERAAAEFGDEAIWFDYRQFDMGVAQELAERIAAQPRCRFVLLAHHGIFTWAETSEQCYHNSLEAVHRARRALDAARCGRPGDMGGPAVQPLSRENADDLLSELLPVIRGALREDGQGVVLRTDTGAEAVAFASSVRGPAHTDAGPGCPDSLVTVGYRPLVLKPGELHPDGVRAAIARFRERYTELFNRYADEQARRHGPRRDLPRGLLLPGIGAVTSGTDATQAAICAEHFEQTRAVIRAADTAGGYTSLTEAQGIADEYWPMMRLKPLLRTAPGRLAHLVCLVVGAGADAKKIAAGLSAEGAHVAHPATVDPRPAVRDAVLAFGGFDVVVDLTGDRRLLIEAEAVFARQRGKGLACLVGHTPANAYDGEHIDVLTEDNPGLVAERVIAARQARNPNVMGSEEKS
ncbi:class II aldolase/adducin family protein [Actinoplanes flavus]|uniref:Class II aldolase/adducin family protein n=1 Tax=Actinoplanes flavus TaxID=2820290 RepID=A0ABS3UTQ1_9ACTN|nr:class II aldolase/adducin family protein [Actinoplanes flavus]MBO3741954.1 class II aldolase/adducin family protein [Actinoplanes flavus]